jgi:hypothetical protein
MEYSSQYAPEGATGQGSARIQHQFKVEPNKVRALPAGQVYVISRGKAMKIAVLQAPSCRVPLPAPRHSSGADVAAVPDTEVPKAPEPLPF